MCVFIIYEKKRTIKKTIYNLIQKEVYDDG